MTPKEKAIELVDKCYQLFPLQKDVIANVGDLSWKYYNWKQAKQCALIAVDEMLEVTAPYCDRYEPYYLELWAEMAQQYWQEVKKEIEKL